MGKTILYNAMLFSKELGPKPYKYRLYFAIQESGKDPEIHRLYVVSAQKFNQFNLGGVYDLGISGIRICDAQQISMENLTDLQYLRLVDLRDLQFMNDRDAKRFGIMEDDYDPALFYYSYKTYKSLVEYDPPFITKFLVYLFKMIGYILSFFIPMALYMLFIYTISLLGKGGGASQFHAIVMPLAAMLALPSVFLLISTLHSLIDTCLLSFHPIRAYMLRGYALRWGGFKKSIILTSEHKKQLIVFGAVCMGLLTIGLLLVFIVL